MTRIATILLILPLCACQRLTTLVRPDPIECSIEAATACDGPIIPKGQTLGESEPIDAANDGVWLICVQRHTAAVDCLRALDQAGFIRFRAASPINEGKKQ